MKNAKKDILEELYEIDSKLKLNDTKVEEIVNFMLKNNPKIQLDTNFRNKLHQKLNTIGEFKQIEEKPRFGYAKFILPVFLSLAVFFIGLQAYNYAQLQNKFQSEDSFIVEDMEQDASVEEASVGIDEWEIIDSEWDTSSSDLTETLSDSDLPIDSFDTPLETNENTSTNSTKIVENSQTVLPQTKIIPDELTSSEEDTESSVENIEPKSELKQFIEPKNIINKQVTERNIQEFNNQFDDASVEQESENTNSAQSSIMMSESQTSSWARTSSGATSTWSTTASGTMTATWSFSWTWTVSWTWSFSWTWEINWTWSTTWTWVQLNSSVYDSCDGEVLIVNNQMEERLFIKQFCDNNDWRIFDNERLDVYMCRLDWNKVIGIDYIEKEVCK